MKKLIPFALLAFAILAGCTKDDNLTPIPNPPPDTKDYNTIPLGAVQAPYLVIKYVDWNKDLKMIKVNIDGSAYEPVLNPKWSSYSLAGDKMVFLQDKAVYLFDFAAQSQVKLYEDETGIDPNLVISPNGNKVAFLTNTNVLYVMETRQDAVPVEVKGLDIYDRQAAHNLSFSPDACYLAFIENGQLLMADLTKIERDDNNENDFGSYRSIQLSDHAGTPSSEGDRFPVFTRDCQNIVYVSDRYTPYGPGDLAIVPLERGGESTQVRLTNLYQEGLTYPAFPAITQDGNDIFFMAKNAQAIYGIYRVPLNGGSAVEIAPSVIGPNFNLYGVEYVHE